VADPFCGRGTTIFAARLKVHQAYGIDASPIAIAIARAKLAETTDEEVLDLAEKILESQPKVRLPKGEFWEWAYDANTLKDVCILREGLRGILVGRLDVEKVFSMQRHWRLQFTAPLQCDSTRIFEQTCRDSPKDEAADVRQVRHASGLHLRYRPGIEELGEEPKADQECSRDEGNPHKHKKE
jgi:hypothetical protein